MRWWAVRNEALVEGSARSWEASHVWTMRETPGRGVGKKLGISWPRTRTVPVKIGRLEVRVVSAVWIGGKRGVVGVRIWAGGTGIRSLRICRSTTLLLLGLNTRKKERQVFNEKNLEIYTCRGVGEGLELLFDILIMRNGMSWDK